ncbi:MAG: tRNA (adenosine(37)-N6)-threonylcarbamoyltransferase complex ATPase subunit type 1 TsaE [Kiritimatiellae bacterium]|nr:tRNA (adenosine(37)-N6)-threonylcarbamoyltransferase complex ATPase subunit type 1 TsaE [Kiritimatiellia bacterium]
MNESDVILTTTSRSVAETHALAAALLERFGAPLLLALHGELGSGKTCFVQGLALALGIDQPATSPTFTIVNEYRGQARRPAGHGSQSGGECREESGSGPGCVRLYHIDLYRIGSSDEALDFGLDEYLYGDGVTAIEWADRAADLIPATAVHVHFEAMPNPNHRAITVRRLT